MTAAEMILKKALVGSDIPSKEWSRVQAGLRERAFFSAHITKLRILEELRKETSNVASGEKSASEVRRDIRKYLEKAGYTPDPGDEGTIKDLFSRARLDVIIKTNVDQARGWAQHLEATTAGALKAFPAYELVRVEEREQPRDWAAKWAAAGGQFYGSRMIALKTDSIWTRISRFDNPYPPFDYNSGMGVADVSRSECLALGVISEDDEPQTPPPRTSFNNNLSAELPMRDDSNEAKYLKRIFEDQIRFDGNIVHWEGELIKQVMSGAKKKVSLGVGFNGKKVSLSHNYFKEHLQKHYQKNETRKDNIPLEDSDYELLPSLWRKPDSVKDGDEGRSILKMETFDGGTLQLIYDPNEGIRSFYKKKNPQGAS